MIFIFSNALIRQLVETRLLEGAGINRSVILKHSLYYRVVEATGPVLLTCQHWNYVDGGLF